MYVKGMKDVIFRFNSKDEEYGNNYLGYFELSEITRGLHEER